ncbi:MAG: hypothetical protein EA424_14840 [Planctomycetaceae bacterium]|nr:MAG: hypothetical protein EA424_14840 [Planctomycetaceae bacterium]
MSLVTTGVLVLSSWVAAPLRAADMSFVGVLALAVERDVAAQLELSDTTRQQLLELIDRRENQALEMVQENRDLPPSEQAARLLPFVAESERMGFALLTLQQRQKLQSIRVARSGMLSLGEAELASSLGLSDAQRQSVQQLLQQRATDLTRGGENEQRITRAIYERKLASLLTEPQRATWEKMAGLTDASVESAASEPTQPIETETVDSEHAESVETIEPAEPAESVESVESVEPAEPAVTDAASDAPLETVPADAEPAAVDEASDGPMETTPAPTVTETPEPQERQPDEMELMDEDAMDEDAMDEDAMDEDAMDEDAMDEDAMDEDAMDEELMEDEFMELMDLMGEPDDGKLRFSFHAAPWREVLEWFADRADLSLVVEVLPVGTFTYRDDRAYEVDQALDLLNSYLLTRGYTLVRRERLLLVIDLESPIPEELITLVTLEELDDRGRYELVKCVFPLARMTADEARRMIEGFLGPQGMVIAFPAARQILVTETAGKLRTIRDMIARVEDPKAGGMERIVDFPLNHVIAEEVLAIARPLLGLAPDQNFNAEISISVDPLGTRLFATGDTEKMQLLADLIPRIDREAPPRLEDGVVIEDPTLRTYYIKSADPQLVYRTVQTMLANQPEVRMDLDTTSGKLVVLARPDQHQLVKDTITELEGQTKRFEVIQLQRSDPQFIILALNKFFNLGGGEDGPNPDDPIIDGDPLSMRLWVRATEPQIEQIRELIDTLEGPEDDLTARSNFRILPLTGTAAQSALDTVERLWDRRNPIRMVTPSALQPSDVRLRSVTPLDEEEVDLEELFPLNPPNQRPQPVEPLDPSAGRESRHSQFLFTSQLQPDAETSTPPADAQTEEGPPEIRVAITPGGLLISSDDAEALDKFEELLRLAVGPAGMMPQREITVFHLRYAQAEVANTLLQEVLSGPGADSGGSLLGDVTSNLLGGGMLGGLLGGLAGGVSNDGTTTMQGTGLITVVPDPRLNALIVEANEVDLAFVEQLLRVIDRESSITDIETSGVPRLIPVIYNSADEIAGVVRQVYADRIATPGGQQRQPSPEDLIRLLRGQRGGGGGQDSRGEVQKMTIGVDPRSNALIITAPEPLFRQVEMLVQQIDQPGSPDADYVLIQPIKVSDPEVVKRTLGSLMTTPAQPRTTTTGQQQTGARPDTGGMDQRIEFFRRLREAGGFGEGGPGGGPPGGGAVRGTGGAPAPTGGAPTRGGATGGRGGRGR